MASDRPDEAQKILEKAIQEDPKNPAFYKELAMNVLLVEIIVAHVVVHGLGVGCVAVAVWAKK